jgi:hypothetical protein
VSRNPEKPASSARGGEEHLDLGARVVAPFAQVDGAAVAARDPERCRETQTATRVLGGEEGVE